MWDIVFQIICAATTGLIIGYRLGKGKKASRPENEYLCTHHQMECQRAEESLRESQRALATLRGNLPGMAYRCLNDPSWTIKFVSEGCYPLTGYLAAELIENRTISY